MRKLILTLAAWCMLALPALGSTEAPEKWSFEGKGAVSQYGAESHEGLKSHTGGTFRLIWVQGATRPLYIEIGTPHLLPLAGQDQFLRIMWDSDNGDYIVQTHETVLEHGDTTWILPRDGIGAILADFGVTMSIEDIGRIIESGRAGTHAGWRVTNERNDNGTLIMITSSTFPGPDSTRIKVFVPKEEYERITARK